MCKLNNKAQSSSNLLVWNKSKWARELGAARKRLQTRLWLLAWIKARLSPSPPTPSLPEWENSLNFSLPTNHPGPDIVFLTWERGETRLQDKKNRRTLLFWAYLSPLLISVFTGAFAWKQQRNSWTSENNKEEGQTHIITYYRETI